MVADPDSIMSTCATPRILQWMLDSPAIWGISLKQQKLPSSECKSTFFFLMTKWHRDTQYMIQVSVPGGSPWGNRQLVWVLCAIAIALNKSNIRGRRMRRRRKEELKKEGRKEMDSDSNTGSAGSTQIQYKYIGEIQDSNTIQIQGQAGQFTSSGKKPVGAELLPILHQATTRLPLPLLLSKQPMIKMVSMLSFAGQGRVYDHQSFSLELFSDPLINRDGTQPVQVFGRCDLWQIGWQGCSGS